MSAMEPSAASQPAVSERPRADATTPFKTAGAPSDRHFATQILPGLVGPDFPFPPVGGQVLPQALPAHRHTTRAAR